MRTTACGPGTASAVSGTTIVSGLQGNRMLVGVICVALLAASAQAAPLLTFAAQPASAGLPELRFDNIGGPLRLYEGAGAIGNADGTLAVNLQTQPGLQVDTPLIINGVPGGFPNVPASATTFYDVSMSLTGLNASGTATVVGPVIVQPLGNGGFTLLSTDPDGPGGPQPSVTLLTGTIGNAAISGLAGSTNGAVLSATVAYTGGVIYNELINNGGTTTGELSWSFLDATPVLSVNQDNGLLNNFDANATGLFSTPVIPEPSATALLTLGLLRFARRPSRRCT